MWNRWGTESALEIINKLDFKEFDENTIINLVDILRSISKDIQIGNSDMILLSLPKVLNKLAFHNLHAPTEKLLYQFYEYRWSFADWIHENYPIIMEIRYHH